LDAVLAAHQVAGGLNPRQFELAGLRTASVRDQMIRAMVITQRLFEGGTIGAGKLPLLVVGGGAGGVTAAMHAAELGAQVVLCEKEHHYFARQADSTRTLDPTEYDWPHPHWKQRRYPWHEPAMPLHYEARPANELAVAWERSFAHWRRKSAASVRLQCRPGTELAAKHLQAETAHMLATGPAFPAGQKFAAVLSFAGMLREKCRVPEKPAAADPPAYEGFPYWWRDPYGEAQLGLPTRKRVRVLISGGGDGALQDFIRVLTGLTARECAQRLGVEAPPESLLMASAEDLGRRAHAWRGRAGPIHGTLHRWHAAFEAAALQQWQRWTPAQRKHLAATVLRPQVRVTLVHRCEHFDHSFALNRYLVLLLARLHARSHNMRLDRVLRSGQEVSAVAPADGHTCGNPGACHGLPHVVHTLAGACHLPGNNTSTAAKTAAKAGTKASPTPLGEFECVIVRHGVEPNRVLGHALVPEHLLPHHVPG
jgi:hypothetical protein